MHYLRTGALICAALIAAGAAGVAAEATAPQTLTIQMKALNGSGQDGTATLTQQKDGVHVEVALKNAPKGVAEPTHVHAGTCGNINKAPEYPLTNTTDGTGSSIVKGVKLSDLTSGKYAINVHKSADDLPAYVSCGNIK